MHWDTLYPTCFPVGVILSVIAFVGGSLHLPHAHFHLSHGHIATPRIGGHGRVSNSAQVPAVNFGTITAFLAWFGGTGYLPTRHSGRLRTIILRLPMTPGPVGPADLFSVVVEFFLTPPQP